MDIYPSEYTIIYNVSKELQLKRFNYTELLLDDRVFRNSDTHFRRSIDRVNTSLVYYPHNPNQPGFDSCWYIRSSQSTMNVCAGNSNSKSREEIPLLVLNEQKISSRKSRLFINIYKDIIRKRALSLGAVQNTQWSNNTLFIGHYMRALNPVLTTSSGSYSNNNSSLGGKVSGNKRSLIKLKRYQHRFEIPMNTIVMDEYGLNKYMCECVVDLLQLVRHGKSKYDAETLEPISSLSPRRSNKLFDLKRRYLQYIHQL